MVCGEVERENIERAEDGRIGQWAVNGRRV